MAQPNHEPRGDRPAQDRARRRSGLDLAAREARNVYRGLLVRPCAGPARLERRYGIPLHPLAVLRPHSLVLHERPAQHRRQHIPALSVPREPHPFPALVHIAVLCAFAVHHLPDAHGSAADRVRREGVCAVRLRAAARARVADHARVLDDVLGHGLGVVGLEQGLPQSPEGRDPAALLDLGRHLQSEQPSASHGHQDPRVQPRHVLLRGVSRLSVR